MTEARIRSFLGSYLHEDWWLFDEEPEDVARSFASDEPADLVDETIAEMRALLDAGSEAEIEEVFLDATVALSAVDFAPASLPALLHTIAKRRFVDDARRRRHSVDGSLADRRLDELPALECDRDDRRAIGDAITLLEPAERRIVTMRLLHGCSFREIARTFDVSEAAAKMRLQRALAVLRRSLEEQGVVAP